METATDEKIIVRIQKLLRKADPNSNPNEHEIAACMARVAELVAEHNLRLQDIPNWEETVKVDVTHKYVKMGAQKFANFAWCRKVLNGVRFLTHVDAVELPSTRQFGFIGSEAEVEIALELYTWIVAQMQAMAKAHLKSLGETKDTKGGRAFYNQYMMGMGSRVSIRAGDLARNNPLSTQMVLVQKERNENELARMGVRTSTRNASRTKTDYETAAARLGYEDGNKVKLQKETAALQE